MTTTPITIIVADAQAIARNGLATMLQQQESIKVLAQAESGDELAALCRQQMPDLVIAAASLTLKNGDIAIQHIAGNFPQINTIVTIDGPTPAPLVIEKSGATAWISKNIKEDDLVTTIHAVHTGAAWHSTHSGYSSAVLKNVIPLTYPEMAIIKCLPADPTAKEIAATTKMQTRTIEKYKQNLMHKLGVKGVAGIVIFAIKNNIIIPSLIYWLMMILPDDPTDLLLLVPDA